MERSGLQPGGLLEGRYRLEQVIGAGGMATVWLATDERLGRKVAVKALSDTLATDPAYVARFEREARVAAGLSHPNLVEVLDSGAAGDRPYLVMEYIDGPTLAEVLERDPGSVDAEHLARELLGALRHIHANGIVHRDVKPANVLIGADGRARLTDFGIARPEDGTQLTQTGQVVGTLNYMAPELIKGEQASERSDLYSCGVLLRECAGERPEGSVARLVKRLTARRPRRRPPSAQAALGWLGSPAQTAVASADSAQTRVLPRTGVADAEVPGETAPTEKLAPSGQRRLLLVLAAAAAIAAALLVALNLGSGDSGGGGAVADRGRGQAAPGGAQEDAAARAEGNEQACSVLEGQRTALRAQRKVALKGLSAIESEAQRQAQEYFRAREETLEVALRSCRRRAPGQGAGAGPPATQDGQGDTGGEPGKGAKPGEGPKQGKGPKEEKAKKPNPGKGSKAAKD